MVVCASVVNPLKPNASDCCQHTDLWWLFGEEVEVKNKQGFFRNGEKFGENIAVKLWANQSVASSMWDVPRFNG